MPQNGDFGLTDTGRWVRHNEGQWYPVLPEVNTYLNGRYDGVSGTGPSQTLIPFDDNDGRVGRPVSSGTVLANINTDIYSQPGFQEPQYPDSGIRADTKDDKNTFGQMTQWAQEFTDDPSVVYPFKDRYGQTDTDMMQQFVVWGKATGKFSEKDVTSGPTATPEAVGIGGQQYFQQPGADGQFERIPEAKAGGTVPEIVTHGGIQFMDQGGELTPIDNVMKKMKENFVVTGDFQGAAAVHSWETRPSNQEYFDRMLQYVNAPADQLLISAIARGQGLVAPPPEETIQRIGPQPEYLTEAFNMMRDQMQMGQPGEGETAQGIMEQRLQEREDQAAQLQLQSQEIANKTAEANLQSQMVKDADAHAAAVTANETAVTAYEFQSTINNMDLNDRITAQYNLAQQEGGEPGDFSFPESLAASGLGDMDIDDDEVEPVGISAFDSQEAAGKSGTDLADRGGRGISMNDGSTAQTIQDFFDGLSDKQKEFVNGWEGGIWTFAQSAQNMAELERNLNFHFNNSPETVGKVIPQVGGSYTEITEKGLEIIEELGNEGESELAAEVIELAPELISEAPMEPGEIGEYEIQRAGTTGEGMSRAEIFEKYPFLAPKGSEKQYTGGQVDEFGKPIVPNTYLNDPMFNIDKSMPTQWNQPDYDDSLPWTPKATPEQIAASQPYDYGSEGGSLASDRQLEAQRAFESGNRALAAKIIEEEARWRDEMANQPPPSASSFVTATQPRGSILKQNVPVTPYGTDFGGGGDEYDTTPLGVGTPQPTAPVYYPEDDIGEYIAPAPAPVLSTPTPTPVSTVGMHGASVRGGNYPRSEPHSSRVTQAITPDPEPEYDSRWYDEGANGIRTGAKPTLVGESGPELALFPNGTEIVPLDRGMKPSQARRLRRRGIRGMQEGGIVFEDPRDNPLPLGIRQLQAGRSLGAPRGQLLRTAGIALPSAQARRRMLPSEREAFQGLGRMAGIPEGEFQQELGITTPSGARRTGSAKMLPLSLRR